MTDLAKLATLNNARWQAMAVQPELVGIITSTAKRLLANKARFQKASAATGVPWAIVAVIKEREAGADELFLRNIAQGDPWNRASTHVPSGRGPFKSWDEAAYDALMNCAPYAGKNKDWSIGGALTLLERYNGLGYSNKGLPSPYIWASTNQYESGKYVADGHFDPNAVDRQIGCAALLKCMFVIEPTADFTRAFPPPPDIPAPGPSPHADPVPQPASSGFFNALISALAALFRK